MLKKHSVSIIIIIVACLIIFIPMWSTKPWKNFIRSIRFIVPAAPDIQMDNKSALALTKKIKPYRYQITQGSEEIVLKLQKLGWPAYWQDNKAYVGPYLDANQQFTKQNDLKQITQQNVIIEDYRINT